MLKTTFIEERSVHTIQKVAKFDSDRKKSIKFQTINSDITTYNHR